MLCECFYLVSLFFFASIKCRKFCIVLVSPIWFALVNISFEVYLLCIGSHVLI